MAESIAGYEVHVFAGMWPPLEGKKLAEFETDIRIHGVRYPIILDQHGRIIDGRTRAKAWEVLNGEDPDWGKDYPLPTLTMNFADDSEIFDFVISSNAERRHISKDQIVAIGLRMNDTLNILMAEAEAAKAKGQFKAGQSGNPTGKAKEQVHMESCEPASKPKRDGKAEHARSTVGKLAKVTGTSHHKAAQGVKVKKASEKLIEKVATGEVQLSEAAKVAVCPDLVGAIERGEKTPEQAIGEAKERSKGSKRVAKRGQKIEKGGESSRPITPDAKHLPNVIDWLNRTATMAEVDEVHKVCVSILGL